MTVVFNSPLGQLIQTQFGINEIASCVVVAKSIGSVLTYKSEASIFEPLAKQFGLSVRPLPAYLETVKFERSGTILGDRQRPIQATQILEDVTANSVEAIATLLALALRHVEQTADLVDYIEGLLKGRFWIVGRPDESLSGISLPRSLRSLLRSFITSVSDADADSENTRAFRISMTKLACAVGNAYFAGSATTISQNEQNRFLDYFFGNYEALSNVSKFNTFSARAATVALAFAANGANIRVRVMNGKQDDGEQIVEPKERSRKTGSVFVCTLWLVQPPPEISEELRSSQPHGVSQQHLSAMGPLPVFGGRREISDLIFAQMEVDCAKEYAISLWEESLKCGHNTSIVPQAIFTETSNRSLLFKVELSEIVQSIQMPVSLTQMADSYFEVKGKDPRKDLARLAASIIHQVFNYSQYDGWNAWNAFRKIMDFVVVALMTGWIEKLSSLKKSCGYAWTVDIAQFKGYAESIVCQGLSTNTILLTAARIWGGMPPSYAPTIPSNTNLMGIVCPHIVILVNVLFDAETVARYGVQQGLFSLYQGSAPMIPRDQFSGFILAGEPRYRRAIQYVDASHQAPMDEDTVGRLIFTMEPERNENGVLAALLCGWMHGNPAFEMDPFIVLAGLMGERNLDQFAPRAGTPLAISHMGPGDLVKYDAGFKVRNGNVVVRAGSRTDLQVLAAGCYLGSRTIMVMDQKDADTVLNSPGLANREDNTRGMPWETPRESPIDSVFIFCNHFTSDQEVSESQE